MPQVNRRSSLGHWYAPVLALNIPATRRSLTAVRSLRDAKVVPTQGMASSAGGVKIPAFGQE